MSTGLNREIQVISEETAKRLKIQIGTHEELCILIDFVAVKIGTLCEEFAKSISLTLLDILLRLLRH